MFSRTAVYFFAKREDCKLTIPKMIAISPVGQKIMLMIPSANDTMAIQ